MSRLHQQKTAKSEKIAIIEIRWRKVQLLIAALALCNCRALLISQVLNLLSCSSDVEGLKIFV